MYGLCDHNRYPKALMRKTLLVSMATMLMLANSAHAVTKYPNPKDYEESSQSLEDCKTETHRSKDFCDCAYHVSEGLLQNGPIFNMFVQSEIRNKTQLAKLREYVLDSNLYNEHIFSSRRDKREYIEGKFTLFSQRLSSALKSPSGCY